MIFRLLLKAEIIFQCLCYRFDMTDSMISRCHCHITAILPQKRQNGPAGGPTSVLEVVVCHHLPFLGHKVGDHQRARDSLQGPSLDPLRGLGRYGAGPLDATTRASTQALWWPSASSSLVHVAYLSALKVSDMVRTRTSSPV